MADLTDEQAAIYDRQIRLWGAGVQKRLMDGRVLILGCTALAAEVSKNFILAGVGNLTLVDDTPSAETPMTFLSMHNVSAGDNGTVAQLFAAGLQEMNPMVNVSAKEGSSSVLPDKDFLSKFGLVLCFGQNCQFLSEVNDACRECGVKFMCAVSRGGIVWGFADLLKHNCVLNIEQSVESEKKELSLEYRAMKDCVSMPLLSLPKVDQRKVNGFLGPWTVITKLEMEKGRLVTNDDVAALVRMWDGKMVQQQCPDKFWSAESVVQYLSGHDEFAPANAIAGGFFGNDVVRIVSQAGLPTYNVFIYSIADNVAQVHNLTGGTGVHN